MQFMQVTLLASNWSDSSTRQMSGMMYTGHEIICRCFRHACIHFFWILCKFDHWDHTKRGKRQLSLEKNMHLFNPFGPNRLGVSKMIKMMYTLYSSVLKVIVLTMGRIAARND
jgi:hypothetical protein